MNEYETRGHELRILAKSLVQHFMQSNSACQYDQQGMTQAQIFRECGFDWGNKIKSPSTQQQHWVVALLRELEEESIVERVSESGPWRLLRKHITT